MLAILLGANISSIMLSGTLDEIRSVDVVRLVACGMLMGALIVTLVSNGRINKE